jgi:hypothetical protein
MNFKVTDKIKKGEIVLPTIGYAVKAGALLTLDKEKSRHSDIRFALTKGYLELTPGQEQEDDSSQIKIRNVTRRPIVVGGIQLAANEIVGISKDELESTGVQTAKKAGLISVEEPETQPEKETVSEPATAEPEVPVEKPKKTKKTQKRAKKQAKAEVEEKPREKKISDEDPIARQYIQSEKAKEEALNPANMRTWDPQQQRMLSKDESLRKVVKRVSTDEDIEEVQSGNVDFSDQSPNKLKMKTANTQDGKVSKGIKPVGQARSRPSADEEEPSFVDKEQSLEKARSLGRDTAKDPEEIGFVDKEQERERIKSFRKIRRNNSELE